jgi:hypothetical protein
MHSGTLQDIDDSMSQLVRDARAAMAQAGAPTGFLCGAKWISTGDPICDLCNGSGGIASACVCPECQP